MSPRLLFFTSGLSSITEHASGSSPRYALAPAGWPKSETFFLAYRSSKCGLNMVAAEWARVLRNDGVKVFDISPGFLNTGLGDDRNSAERRDKGALGAINPAIGGEYCADVVEGKLDEQVWPIKALRRTMVQPW
ncbi:hypothetical protein LEMA_P086650.1 [Plenodomus lingam JN3]|uniref:Uncharacterized protein n=2 Tax=Leptosphaeria maculans TaxID=5022 RepID=E5A731_LEPMJ|nr:hypothetical protein LEMA_P086650.1 [Plenodomus lingam JN3]CBX99426.1 hypothetical protein LEMA_P086650.1 [Plenodomus lingam JN3]